MSGLIGGILGFVFSKILEAIWEEPRSTSGLRLHSGLSFLFVITAIGAAILAGNALLEKQMLSEETLLIAIPALLVGGFIAGFLAQSLYEAMVPDRIYDCDTYSCIKSAIRPARTLGWGLAGLLGGAAVGGAFRSWKRLQNGVIGGTVGGLIGGLLFDAISIGTDTGSQVIAITLIGLLMGTLIGLIDTARTSMWLEVVGGELRGRQFIVMDTRTTLGCASSANVRVLADRSIKEIHLVINGNSPGATFNCSTSDPVYLNGQMTTGGSLSNGDLLRVGNTDLRVGFRKAGLASGAVPSGHTVTPPGITSAGDAAPRRRPTATEAASGYTNPVSPSVPPMPPTSAPAPGPAPTPAAGQPQGRPRLNVQKNTE